MKKVILIMLTVFFTIANNNVLINANEIDLKYDSEGFDISINDCILYCDGNVYSVDNTRYFSIRDIAEVLGLGIEWDSATRTISIRNESKTIFPYQKAYDMNFVSEELWGYKDYDGNFVSVPQFYSASKISCGLAKVQADKSNQYKYGYINSLGETILPCIYSDARDFSDGIALVSLDDSNYENMHYFFINTNGERIIDRDFYGGEVGIFNKGYAPLMKEGNPYPLPNDNKTKVWSYMDIHGEYATELEFEETCSFDNNGYAYVKKNNKWGMINTDFNFVVDCIYESYKEIKNFYNTRECSFTNFNISVDGSNKDILNGIMVVNDRTYLSSGDIGRLLSCTIDENEGMTGLFITLLLTKV